MSNLGEIAFGEPLVNAGFGPRDPILHRHPIYTLPSHPELIVRPANHRHGLCRQDVRVAQTQLLTEGLLRLDADYGLRTPGLSLAREVVNDQVQLFLVTPRVEGFSFADGLSEIPELVATTAFASILQYHRDFIWMDGVYLDDVRLPQLMYGKTASDTENRVYFVDVEQQAYEISKGERENSAELQDQASFTALVAARGINLLESSYGKELTDLRKQAGQLLVAYGRAFRKVAGYDYDHANWGNVTPDDMTNINSLLAGAGRN
jgi:hypothetical protein